MFYRKYLIILILVGCSTAPVRTNRQLFDDFHTSFAKGDFEKMNQLLADDFIFILDGKVSSLKADYIKYMSEWNKTFDTKWNVVSVQEVGDQIQSIEYDTDIYNNFFYGGPMRYRYTYSLSKNRIQRLTADSLKGTGNLRIAFEDRFRSFYEWVTLKFPDKLKYFSSSDKASAIAQKELLQKYLSSPGVK
jgi:hypothetical protein